MPAQGERDAMGSNSNSAAGRADRDSRDRDRANDRAVADRFGQTFGGGFMTDSPAAVTADDVRGRFNQTFGGGYLANAAPGFLGNPRNENAGFGVGNSAPPGGGGLTMADLQQLLGQYLQQPPQPDPFQFQFMPQQQSFMQQYPQPSFMGTPQNVQELYQMYQPQQQNMQQPSYGDWLTNRSF